MKSKVLSILLLIPIITSCNQENKGFIDPFPDDTYRKVGFNIDESEKIETSLTQKDKDLITFTIDNPLLYSNIIKQEIMIRERDYSRAFAGEFKSGYESSNKMVNEDIVIFRQDESSEKLKKRKEKNVVNNTVYDFYYGRNSVTTNTDVYTYLAKKNEEEMIEECKFEEAYYTYEQTYINKSEEPNSYQQLLKKPIGLSNNDWDESSFLISQKDYIFNVNTSTASGANKDKEIVLIQEQQIPYKSSNEGEEGVYILNDGRKFRATINSLKVIKLKKQTSLIDGKEIEWLLVKYARIYSETAITSDVIQPNVPITILKNPIVINYKEEKNNFYVGDIEEKSKKPLPDVEPIEESSL